MLTHTTLHTAHCTSTFALLPCFLYLLCLCSTYCVCMFLCSLYAPLHQNKFQVGVNLLGNKYHSDSDSDSDVALALTVEKGGVAGAEFSADVTFSQWFVLKLKIGR